MAYTPTTWTDGDTVANAARLNKLEQGVKEAHDLAESGTSGTVPIFPSQAEAQAWEAANPGKVALWFDGGTTPPDPEDIPVPVTAPTWTDDATNGGGTWTTPTLTGATYSPASGTATPGQAVTVTATAQTGYYLTGYPSGGWSHTFPEAPGTGYPAGTYATTFAADTVGQPPADWSTPWSTSGLSWDVVTDAPAEGGKSLRVSGTTTEQKAYVWDEPTEATTDPDLDVLFKLRMASDLASGNAGWRPLVRASESTRTGINLLLAASGERFTCGGLIDGSIVSGGFGNIPATDMLTAGRKYLRIRAEGSTLSVKTWLHGAAEPATWNGSQTIPAGLLGPGKVGIYHNNATNPEVFVEWVSVAVGGDVAPDLEA